MARKKVSDGVSRISVSLPPMMLEELDKMVTSRGYGSRSRAIGDMVSYQLAEHKRSVGDDVMVGTVTILYNRLTPGLQRKLADLQFSYINEVISSLHVHLTQDQLLEVILVQGPANRLQNIANELLTKRGVITGRLQLLAGGAIPPVHAPVFEGSRRNRPPDGKLTSTP